MSFVETPSGNTATAALIPETKDTTPRERINA